MKGLIDFIEDYLNREEEWSRKTFAVNVDSVATGGGFLLRNLNHRTKETITLDEEDLRYLFDKYFPLYDQTKAEVERKQQEYIDEQIKGLEDKLKKLKEQKYGRI